MNNSLHIQPCLREGEDDFPADTPLYKYLPIEAFLYLNEFERINFTRITDWPDAYEGSRFEFFSKAKNDQRYSNKSKNEFYGSCWTLQTDDLCLYESTKEYDEAIKELLRNGSASMWDSYCPNGGVRIKTTIGKINKLILCGAQDCSVFRGKAYYEPATSWNKTIKTYDLVSTLFMKRVSFRHEAEYRYILVPNKESQELIISLPIGNLFEFIDEILISPATTSKKWVSRTLYNMSVGISLNPKHQGANHKNGKQFCRVSQLYGIISETLGHYEMG
jgi:hypothetical protein